MIYKMKDYNNTATLSLKNEEMDANEKKNQEITTKRC